MQTLIITENEIILSRRREHLDRLILCPLVKLYVMTKKNRYSINSTTDYLYKISTEQHNKNYVKPNFVEKIVTKEF